MRGVWARVEVSWLRWLAEEYVVLCLDILCCPQAKWRVWTQRSQWSEVVITGHSALDHVCMYVCTTLTSVDTVLANRKRAPAPQG